MSSVKVISGRIAYVDSCQKWLVRGSRLEEHSIGANSCINRHALPVGPIARISMDVPVLSRLQRSGVHHVVPSPFGAMVFANRDTYIVRNGEVSQCGQVVGSRPLCVCFHKGRFYYGEYRNNRERTPIRLWRYRPGESAWEPCWMFSSIRHVHGVFHDPWTDTLWVTTGDEDKESGVWVSEDGGRRLDRVVGGSQQFRVVQLVFTEDYVYFGSDAPNEENYLYRMSRCGTSIEQLASVGSSVFYGCAVGDTICFSTVVEPSVVNQGRDAVVWRSEKGEQWYPFMRFRKDVLPMKGFQYGQVLFAGGDGGGNTLCLTPMSTYGNGRTWIIDLSK